MFKSQSDTLPTPEAETVIAAGVRVEGDFVSEGNVRIEGSVHGSIATERDLTVGEHASITASVIARNAILAGEVHGNLRVYDRLELASTARIAGDIQAKVLAVAPGAVLRGQVTIGQDVTAAEPEAKPVRAAAPKSAREKKIEELLQQPQ